MRYQKVNQHNSTNLSGWKKPERLTKGIVCHKINWYVCFDLSGARPPEKTGFKKPNKIIYRKNEKLNKVQSTEILKR